MIGHTVPACSTSSTRLAGSASAKVIVVAVAAALLVISLWFLLPLARRARKQETISSG